jgi:PAS domain S-box-containing protein
VLRVAGYKLEIALFAGTRCAVYAAIRESDGARMVLKTTTSDAAAAEVRRFKRAYEIGRTINVLGCCRTVDFFEEGRRPYLVMEPFHGRPLSELLADGPLDARRAVAIGLSLAEALGRLHECGVVHADINPGNLLVAADDSVQIIDLDMARPVNAGGEAPSRAQRIEGTLRYMAPEQTGRLHRPLDQRADLYGAGGTLYEMLTGLPPFSAPRAAGLIHAHLAVAPAAPHAVQPSVPAPLSELVLRLLAKEPDDRYQTAWGLAADLRLCASQLEAHGRIEVFELGAADISTRLRLDQHLFERTVEREILLEHARRAAHGSARLALVRGESGVGKSTLLQRFFAPMARQFARVAGGAYGVRGGALQAGLRHAFAELVDLLMSEPDVELAATRAACREALGDDAAIAADALPSLAALLGPLAPAPPIEADEARHRFEFAFRRLFQRLATHERPLVLLIDDIQRAEVGDRALLGQLLTDPASAHILVVAAYRDDAGPQAHAVARWADQLEADGAEVARLTIEPLTLAAVEAIVAAALSAPSSEIDPLAREVMAKTQGNPLFVTRFLQSLHQDGALRVDPARGRWTWDLGRIRRLPYTENVASLMARRVRLLPPTSRTVLAAAACMGVTFEPQVVGAALAMQPDDVLRHLWPAIRDDFVLPPPDHAGPLPEPYRFAHDRVHESAYELLTPDQRVQTHLALGWALADAPGRGQAAATQLALGLPRVTVPEERLRVAAIALDAGNAATKTSAHTTARDHLVTAIAALPDGAWDRDFELCMALHLASAANAELLGDFAAAATTLASALGRVRSDRQRAVVLTRKIRLLSHASRPAEAIDAARECLALFGEVVPRTPEEAAVLIAAEDERLARLIAERDPQTLADGPQTDDPDTRLLLGAIAAAANPSYTQLWVLNTVSRMSVRVSLERGHTSDSGHAFVLYGWMLSILGQRAHAELFARTGLALAADGEAAAPLHHLYGCFIEHWLHPWAEGRARLTQTLALARRHGNHETAAWVMMNLAWLSFAADDDLMAAARRIQDSLVGARGQFEHRDASNCVLLTLLHVRALTGGAGMDGPPAEDEEAIVASLQHFAGYLAAHRVQRMIVRCLLGELDEALVERRLAEQHIALAAASLWESRFQVYGALVLTGLWRSTPPEQRVGWLEAIDGALARLDGYAALREDGFAAERDLVRAERASLVDETADLSALYDAAIVGAMEAGDRALTGLAAERCASWHAARGSERLARSYLFDARYAFERWGALAKVARLDTEHGLRQRTGVGQANAASRSVDGSALDLHAALVASRAVSVEIDLERLLGTLMTQVIEVAGATRGCLLIERDGVLLVEAVIEAPGQQPSLMMSCPYTEFDLCAAAVQSVHRSGQPVGAADARASRRFGNDPYVLDKQPRSLLCAPIAHQGRVLAILYLENSLLTGAFDTSRRHALDVIGAQAAISIRNAFLYREQQQTSESLASALAENARLHAELSSVLHDLKSVNARLQAHTRSLERTVRVRTADIERMHRHHERVLRSIDEGILCLDPSGAIDFANPAAARMGGWGHDALVGRSYLELVASETPEPLPDPFADVASTTRDARFTRASGDPLPVEVSFQPIRDDSGELMGAVMTFRDVTRRRTLEHQLQHAQKMEAMGRFAGGVAHDFNNLLTPMLGNVSLVREAVGEAFPRAVPWLEDIERAGLRAGDLVKQVLAFSRRSEVFLKPLDLLPVVDDVARFLARSMDRSIEVIWERPAALAWVHADAGGIHQVLLNLCLNARDALEERTPPDDPRGRRLTIRTDELDVDAAMVARGQARRAGHWVRLSVEDNGVGMPPEVRERMFEPFFTTKAVGAGTGLGLSVVYGIIEQHSGFVVCQSAEGEGTRMDCWLPARAAGATEPVIAAPRAGRGRGERVLIADDEPLMRSLGLHLLESLGYVVDAVDSGTAAVEAFGNDPEGYELVILDIAMPGMGGDEALRQILQIRASARVILWSGYAAPTAGLSAQASGARAFVAKPFRAEELGRVVREVLDGA